MSDNEIFYCLIAFILGWLIARMTGEGFNVGGDTTATPTPPASCNADYQGTNSDCNDFSENDCNTKSNGNCSWNENSNECIISEDYSNLMKTICKVASNNCNAFPFCYRT